MKSLDTNLLFTGCRPGAEGHEVARNFLLDWSKDSEVVLCEHVLVELYNLLRNSTIMSGKPYQSKMAVSVIQSFRHHPKWRVVEVAPVMERVWQEAGDSSFPRRRIFDARIAFTLQHHGVVEFATCNQKDFTSFGFEKLWNPLDS